jgi:outer membrane protein assembly factor BamD (BamD/ComL family)
MKKALLLLLLLPALGWLGGCRSAPADIPPDLTPADFFQKAQEASDTGKYQLALKYYQTFQERYPDERDRGLWARYEIALLHSKMGDEETALTRIGELLALYAGEDAEALPQGPRILAEKIKAKLEAAN